MPDVHVPTARWPRWVDNFVSGHGATPLTVHAGALHGTAADGSWFEARLPFDAAYDGPPEAAAFAAAADAYRDCARGWADLARTCRDRPHDHAAISGLVAMLPEKERTAAGALERAGAAGR